jgi:hypothetical protein
MSNCKIARIREKKMQVHIAPLQPAALAVFPPWGSSQGAGRADLRCKVKFLFGSKKFFRQNLCFGFLPQLKFNKLKISKLNIVWVRVDHLLKAWNPKNMISHF